MNDEQSRELDSWELDMATKKKALIDCQTSKNLSSCFECEKLLECVIRDEYTKSVYDSMSKGETGGFEF